MNVFCAQDLEVRAELMNLASSTARIMSCQSTKNIICITQDALLAAFLLTKSDFDLGRDKFFDICMVGDNSFLRQSWTTRYILDGLERIQKVRAEKGYGNLPLYCGKSLYSLMFPPTLDYSKKNDARVDEPSVKIVKGVLLEGALNKANLGQAHNSLIHVLYKEYSSEHSMEFINNCQFLGNKFLLLRSFTVGIKDCIADLRKESESIAYKCFIEAKDTENTISHDRIRELKICAILDKARDISMKLAKGEMKKDNAFMDTVTSGAKGEFFNLAQITSMLGQQIHMGKRIQKCISKNKRSLPHYPKTNIGIEQEFESAGFIKNSFLNGLNPQEFIWHAISGREGCSNTAMQTASSGYIQRKMIKCSEDVSVRYDGTVRMINDNIVQWQYGDDGFDRTNCAIRNGKINFCDVNSISSRLNNEYEK
jgi:DNA-directed RNA polymerase II subunit RPB1